MGTMRPVVIGRHVVAADDVTDSISSTSAVLTSISCLQFYDVALNEQQLRKTKDICNSKGKTLVRDDNSWL